MDLSLTRRRGGPDTDLGKQTVGNALVVHPAAGMTEEAQALALGVAADDEHDLVVVDLPVDSPISLWESVAKALPRRRRGVRLVIGGRSRETSALAGQWLAERIGRPVLAPDGSVIPSAGGALFVHSGRGSGWVRFQPGRPPKWEAKRFPRPSWDSGVTAELTSTSSRGVAEPLPGGLWIRPVGFDRQLGYHRSALIRGLPALPDTMTIVLGCPGCPPLTMDDAARLWMRLPEPVRHKARFVQYGPMSVPAGTTLGQALADLLGREVGFYSGLPIGAPHDLDVWTVLYDGGLGWATFARELAYVPRQPLPRLLDHRAPIDGLKEIEPAVYWYSPDAVLEVVQSGLLLRPPTAGPTVEALREVTLDTSLHNLTYDVPEEGADAVERMRLLAEDVLARLDEHTRRISRILPAAALLAERARVTIPRRALAEIEAASPSLTPLPVAPPAAPPTRVGGTAPAEAPLMTISERLDPGAVIAATITTAAPPRLPALGTEERPTESVVSGPAISAPPTGSPIPGGPITLPPPATPPAGVGGPMITNAPETRLDAAVTQESAESAQSPTGVDSPAPTSGIDALASGTDADDPATGAGVNGATTRGGIDALASGTDTDGPATGASVNGAEPDARFASRSSATPPPAGPPATPQPEAPAMITPAPLPPPAVPLAGIREAVAGSVLSAGSAAPSPGVATDLPASPASAVPPPAPAAEPPAPPPAGTVSGPAAPATPPAGPGGGSTAPATPPPAVPPAGVAGGPVATAVPPAGSISGPAAPAAPPSAVPPAGAMGGSSAPATPPPAVPPAGVAGGPATPATPSPAVPPAGSISGPAAPATPSPAVPPAGVAGGPITPTTPPPAVPPAGVLSGPAAEAPLSQASTLPQTPPSAASPLEVAGGGTTSARLQPTPAAEASALLPKRGVDKEREWLRKSLGAEYGLMSNAAARILSEHPGFQGALAASAADVLTDAVAVQLYLSAKGTTIDAGLRAGRNGPHVPIARCVVAGLGRLPSHRGPASFATSPTADQWALYRTRKVLTEWGFLHTQTTPMSTSDGDTDILVWSVTARRTKLLEPAEGVVNRALFVPGTSFKVLEITEPADTKRGLVLLRELTVSEVDETGKVAADRISLDELALESLRRELEMWAETDGRAPIAAAAAGRFGVVPGLV
ncbi:hypothetical protein VA596_25205 [Amycolatopsis sp., V23-08]|uniref:Uncharacterized protein n=1 Tax=Amycolatopsis heterodermiae TaxID=3110235 RepID=A0ABU5R9E1_9PSEU|nr:hypothetical protein [Amycolatopsis sp., V23-08]MEA5362857.1 hypothetical protein [Amycolatopsis sp., V23-08]